MRSTNENLKRYATKPLAQWLIHAAHRGSSITYGEAKTRLETEIGFKKIFPTRVGFPAGALIRKMQEVDPNCPLLNILLVQKDNRMPGDGAGSFMAEYLNNDRFALPDFRKTNTEEWREACNKIASDVYAFNNWPDVFHRAFEEKLPSFTPPQSTERDGLVYTRRGEGEKHKKLREWVLENPHAIRRKYAKFRTYTEVVLDSADRVDVVYYGSDSTVVIEVKSSDSNEDDLKRGVFQCIKYRAVMRAMGVRSYSSVIAFLVTQTPLPPNPRFHLRCDNTTC